LFDAQQNWIHNNDVQESIQTVLSVESSENIFEKNNFLHSFLPAIEHNAPSSTNSWQENYWESARYLIEETNPAKESWSMLNASVPDFQPIEFGEVRTDVIKINEHIIWDEQSKTINGGITIERGGHLVIKKSTLTFFPDGMQREAWISVMPGGILEIDESEIYGPDKDHDLRINVHHDADIIMRNSKLHNASSWVESHGAAIGFQGKSALIENNTFENVYCAFSSEPPAANIQFVNNTISNTIEGVTIITDAPNTTIASNLIQQSAIWGIQVWAITPNSGSVIKENQVNNSWGMGIFDGYAGSYVIEPNNTFNELVGPGLVILENSSQLDARQFRPISQSTTNVQTGDNVAVSFNLMPFFPDQYVDEYTYSLVLSVNGAEIAHKEVNVKYGEQMLITLAGEAPSDGVVKLTIQARAR